MSFQPHFSWEFLSQDEIEHRSLRAMKNHLAYIKRDSEYYRTLLADVIPNDICTPDDILKLPFTDKKTLSTKMEQFYVADSDQIAETVVTSGSTGKPLIVPFAHADLERLSYNESLSFHSAGVSPKDNAQILVSLDRLFVAGMAYYRGFISLGVNTMRIGVLAPDMQKHYFSLLKPTILLGVPSYLLKFGKYLQEQGVDTTGSTVNKIFCIGEPLRNSDMTLNSTAEQIETIFGAEIYSTYASTEIASSYCDCIARTGGHSHPELVYTEIIGTDNKPVADGEEGELVITTFGIEGMPLLRYRTGDVTFRVPGICPCGRNSMRIGPILSRKSQLLKIKGTTIYPTTITNAIDDLGVCDDYLIEIRGTIGGNEEIFIHAAVAPNKVPIIMAQIQAISRVNIPILVSNKVTISAMRGNARKQIRLIDNRK